MVIFIFHINSRRMQRQLSWFTAMKRLILWLSSKVSLLLDSNSICSTMKTLHYQILISIKSIRSFVNVLPFTPLYTLVKIFLKLITHFHSCSISSFPFSYIIYSQLYTFKLFYIICVYRKICNSSVKIMAFNQKFGGFLLDHT